MSTLRYHLPQPVSDRRNGPRREVSTAVNAVLRDQPTGFSQVDTPRLGSSRECQAASASTMNRSPDAE